MKFLLDENVDYRLVSFLLQRGYHVTSVAKDYSLLKNALIKPINK